MISTSKRLGQMLVDMQRVISISDNLFLGFLGLELICQLGSKLPVQAAHVDSGTVVAVVAVVLVWSLRPMVCVLLVATSQACIVQTMPSVASAICFPM
jgi:hypothetical protein